MTYIITGTNANDTLYGTNDADTINGKAGNDTITAYQGNDTLRGGGGKDTFVYNGSTEGTDTITDFGGVGKGTNPTAAIIAEVDTIQFLNSKFTARNLLLTQNGNNLEITFENVYNTTKIILQNFKLENFDNLKASGTRPAIGNILFKKETSITDSFNVLDANSTDTSIGIKNTVTFLNDLDNNITGLDNSDDVVNGQGGNDKIDGLSGDDLLRGGAGNDTLIGGLGNDTLDASYSSGYNILTGNAGDDYLDASHSTENNILTGDAGDDYLDISYSTGNNSLVGGIGDDTLNGDSLTGDNTLNGGIGSDRLIVEGSKGDNLLSGGDGNDLLDASVLVIMGGYDFIGSSGNNTLNGGAGDDGLFAGSPESNNLLSGDDGNDYLSTSGYNYYRSDYSFSSSGNNTLNGGIGDDILDAGISTGNNLLSGGDGNDLLSISGVVIGTSGGDIYDSSSGNNTLNGGTGDDTLRAEISTGNNLLSGGDGNDSLYLSTSSGDTVRSYLVTQTVDGGKDDDLLSVNYSNATGGITTTFNATTKMSLMTAGKYRVSYQNIERLNILDTAYDDNIVGSNGNDTLSIDSGGKDTIDGGKGDDLLSVDYNNATTGITTTFNATTNKGAITAGNNNRVSYKNIERLNISGTPFDDNIVGSNGNDTFSTGNRGKDTIDGGKGDDLLTVESFYGISGGITTTFNATTNKGEITAGNNSVSYKNIERLNITGTDYNDNIVGSNGNDTLFTGSGGNDTIDGGTGNDLLSVDFRNATTGITTTFNATTNKGEITADTRLVSYQNIEGLNISGTDYNDNIVGNNGNDTLDGNSGNDTLKGGNGNDVLIGGSGNDSLYGGAGTDTFVFNYFTEGVDRLYDFNATNELIQVSAAGFGGGLSAGVLKTSQFRIGTSATTTSQRFIYNSTTGGLFFDSDGSAGAFTQVQFAQLTTGLSLTNNNFVIV
ncbi:MAG: calcium-binding protein [Nostoc sp. S4]|nr:calcium-binding protein [Nostoc sp. S4]